MTSIRFRSMSLSLFGAVTLAVFLLLSACTGTPAGSGRETGPAGAGESEPSATPTPSPRGLTVADSDLTPRGQVTTEASNQVVEKLDIRGGITISHDNVLVRNVRILQTSSRQGHYALVVSPKEDGTCPADVLVENIEITGDRSVLAPGTKAVYGACAFTLRSSRIQHVASAVRITNNTVIENNEILADHWEAGDDSHRSGVGLNGGSGNVIRGNLITCEGPGCSGALALYGDFARVEDVLVEGNTFATNGSYCVYAGSLSSKPFPIARDVRFIGNYFSRQFYPTCGRYGPVAGRTSDGGPGFVWQHNVWLDTGAEVIP